MNRKICVVTGTRAEYGAIYWLLRALNEDPEIDLSRWASGPGPGDGGPTGLLLTGQAANTAQNEMTRAQELTNRQVAEAKRGLDNAEARLAEFRTRTSRFCVARSTRSSSSVVRWSTCWIQSQANVRGSRTPSNSLPSRSALTNCNKGWTRRTRSPKGRETINPRPQELSQTIFESRNQLSQLEAKRDQLVKTRPLSAAQPAKITELNAAESEFEHVTTE